MERGDSRHHLHVAGQQLGVGHAQRREHTLLEERRERHAADALDRQRQQVIALIAVDHALAGGEVRIAEALADLQACACAQCRRPAAEEHQARQVEGIAHPAGVLHHLAQAGLAAGAFQLGQINACRCVDIQLALFRQQQRGEGGEMLAGRGDAHAGCGGVSRTVLHAGQSKAAAKQGHACRCNADHQAGGIVAVPGPQQLVQLPGDPIAGIGYGRCSGHEADSIEFVVERMSDTATSPVGLGNRCRSSGVSFLPPRAAIKENTRSPRRALKGEGP